MTEKETDIREIKNEYDEQMALYRTGVEQDIWNTGTERERIDFIATMLKADIDGKTYAVMSGNTVPVPEVSNPAGRLAFDEELADTEIPRSQRLKDLLRDSYMSDEQTTAQNEDSGLEIC